MIGDVHSNCTVLWRSLGTLMYCKVQFQWSLFLVSLLSWYGHPLDSVTVYHLVWMYHNCQEEGVCKSQSCLLFSFLLIFLSLLCSLKWLNLVETRTYDLLWEMIALKGMMLVEKRLVALMKPLSESYHCCLYLHYKKYYGFWLGQLV